MKHLFIITLCSMYASAARGGAGGRGPARRFPDGFMFGAASSAYQVEGAWDVDGKTANIWDNLTHTRPYLIADGSSGDVAANSYYLYRRDVQMLKELGVAYYRFSLSWTRILSSSFPDKINYAGVAYYNNLINELLRHDIQPMVTIYHWELPQKLQDMGGWINPHVVTWYADFARVVFKLFGDRVKYWITINEPHQICHYAYGATLLAPAILIPGVAEYICSKNVLLAHATGYHIYDEEFRSQQNGVIFIAIAIEQFLPAWSNQTEAANDANEFSFGQYAHPIFSKTGDYPRVMKTRIAQKSAKQGFPRSRLPELSPEEILFIRGTSDLLGVNHYSTTLVYRDDTVDYLYPSPSFEDDVGVTSREDERNKPIPLGFYAALQMIREDYGNPPVFVTENGVASPAGLADAGRVGYLQGYLSALLDAVSRGCDVRAYTAWSLMDSFEWWSGYTVKYGLYYVDYNSPNRTRVPRWSAHYYRDVVREHALDSEHLLPARLTN